MSQGIAVVRHTVESSSETYAKAQQIRIDGQSMGETDKMFVSDPTVDPRYSPRYAEKWIAAFTLAVINLTDCELLQREAPDFEIRKAARTIAFLEVSSVVRSASARYSSLLTQLNADVERLIRDDPAVRARVEGSFAELVLHDVPAKQDRADYIKEIRSFLLNENLQTQQTELTDVGDAYPLLHSAKAQLIRTRSRGRTLHFAIRPPAKTIGPSDLYGVTQQRLEQKRRQARNYQGRPLWLSLYFAELHAIYETNLAALEAAPPDTIAPFERVFVGDQRAMIEYRCQDQ